MIGTNLNLNLPLLSDTLATVVSKTSTALSAIQTSIADVATVAAINVNGPLSFSGNSATNVGSTTYVAGNVPTAAGSMYYTSGEFFLIDATGTIKVTNLGQLNAAAFGGIGGDYGGANPALESYDNTTGQYRFYTNGGTHAWADIAAHGLFLEGATNTTEFTTDNSVNVNQVVPWGKINSTDLLAWDGSKIIPAGATNSYGTGTKFGGPVTTSAQFHFVNSLQYVVPLWVGTGLAAPSTQLVHCNVGFYNVTGDAVGGYSWKSNPLYVAGGDTITQMSVTFQSVGSSGTKSIKLHSLDNNSANDTVLQTATSTSAVAFTLASSVFTQVTDTSHQYYIEVSGPAVADVFTMVTFSTNRP
jgi:hypothetical protein